MESKRIEYPIDIDGYITHWGRFEVVRELVTNSIDSGGEWSIEREEGKFSDVLIVRDTGDGLALKNLLIGNTGHERSDDKIGQFGEGLKMALIVLTRFGVRADIRSGKYRFWNEPGEQLGCPTMNVVYEETNFHSGTTIRVPWPKDEPAYEDRFLRPNDPRIAWQDAQGRVVLRQDDPDFFHKGVWVQKASYYGSGYSFGYNLISTKMNRDRGVVDSWDAISEIGSKIWGEVRNSDLLRLLWTSIEAGSAERELKFWGGLNNSEALAASFKEYHGQWAVLKTSEDAAREASHRQANVVNLGSVGLQLKTVLETDAEYVMEMEGQSRVPILDKELPDDKKKTLQWLRRMARRVDFGGKIKAFILREGVLGEAHNNNVRLSPAALANDKEALKTLIEEIAHNKHNTADTTDEHVDACLDVAVDLILSYRRK